MPIGNIEHALHLWGRLRTRFFTMLLSSQFGKFGDGVRISPPFRFFGLNEMSFGEKVIVNADCWLQTIPDNNPDGKAKLVVGSYTGIGMGAHISAAKQVVIGEYVLLARNVHISDHSHAFENIEIPIMRQGINGISPVSIGRNSWLGQNVVVLPGVTIGEHCVIGANSVVNSSIPDFSVAVGAPAKIVRRFDTQKKQWMRMGNSNSERMAV